MCNFLIAYVTYPILRVKENFIGEANMPKDLLNLQGLAKRLDEFRPRTPHGPPISNKEWAKIMRIDESTLSRMLRGVGDIKWSTIRVFYTWIKKEYGPKQSIYFLTGETILHAEDKVTTSSRPRTPVNSNGGRVSRGTLSGDASPL